MANSTLDLSGDWWGNYSYPNHAGPTTPFLAKIQDVNGQIHGSIIEPEAISGGPTLYAAIIGYRQDTHVDFTKTYDSSAPAGYENPVDYVGRISGDGNAILGVWSLLDFDGTFEMYRETELDLEREVETSTTVPIPDDLSILSAEASDSVDTLKLDEPAIPQERTPFDKLRANG